MSEPKQSGGYVFPTPTTLTPNGEIVPVTAYGDFGGITRRQLYAGMIAGSLVQRIQMQDLERLGPDKIHKLLALGSWQIADALLAAENEV